jgi:hypothetical protein
VKKIESNRHSISKRMPCKRQVDNMPAIGFICPDGVKVTFEECFNECRLKDDLPCGRCKALPLLRKVSLQREWTGVPSTTQLIGGTREAWLKITRPYFINPEERVFALLGTQVHSVLEKFGMGDNFTEERLRDEICSGAFDFYDGESETLFDYKTWGSYKVAQALGIKSIDVPMLDENGNSVCFKTGARKGQQKTRKEYIFGDVVTKALGIFETSIQMSNYRDKLKQILPNGYTVKNMAVQVISRDAGLMVSAMRHIEEKAPLIPVNGISKHWIDRYLQRKRDLLFEALENDYSPVCRKRERWDGRKCQKYCDVSEACQQVGGCADDSLPDENFEAIEDNLLVAA